MKMQHKNIEIDEDIKFQKRSWVFQRVGMILLLLTVILSLLGFGGNGPLSHGEIQSITGSFKIDYEKITRTNSPIELKVEMNKDVTGNDTLRVSFAKSFIHSVEINTILPDPVEVKEANGNVEFSFIRSSNSYPALITMFYKFRTYGNVEHSILINNEQVKINHFIWP
jgi:hypothetical protein